MSYIYYIILKMDCKEIKKSNIMFLVTYFGNFLLKLKFQFLNFINILCSKDRFKKYFKKRGTLSLIKFQTVKKWLRPP